jgi:hypothetical protein
MESLSIDFITAAGKVKETQARVCSKKNIGLPQKL